MGLPRRRVRVYSGLVWKRFVIWRHKGKWPRC
jgi:hypothetical protein